MTAKTYVPEEPTQPPSLAISRRLLNIALLGYRSHPFVGGQGIYLHFLSKALVEAGHRVDVLSGPPYPELDEGVKLIKIPSLDLFSEDNHVTALRLKHLKSWSDFFEWWSMLTGGFAEPYTFARRAHKYLNRHRDQYDIIHDNQTLAYGILDIEALNIPVVTTLHHPITRDRQLALEAASSRWHRLLVRRWYSFLTMQKKVTCRLKHVVTVSHQSKNDIAEAFGRNSANIDVIPCGIDTELFAPQTHISRQPFRVMTTASADQPLKGLRFLLEAIAMLKPEYPELELLVVGTLTKGGKTHRQLEKLHLENSVRFVSGLSSEAMRDYYCEATVAVSPSLYEGFGLPAGEAMACGCPVITSDGGALPEVVGEAGLIVKAGDRNALADGLRVLLDNPDKRQTYSQLGRERVVNTFSWKITAQKFVHYYEQALQKNSQGILSDGSPLPQKSASKPFEAS